jgi:hypothetical protein
MQVTDKELDQFYGVEATEIEIAQTIGAASTEFAAGEMADIAYENFEAIADAGDDAEAVGRIIIMARKQWIADCASRAIYGRVGVINPNEVKV